MGSAELSFGLDSHYCIFQSQKNHWNWFLKLKEEISSCITGGGQKSPGMFHCHAHPLQTLHPRALVCSSMFQFPSRTQFSIARKTRLVPYDFSLQSATGGQDSPQNKNLLPEPCMGVLFSGHRWCSQGVVSRWEAAHSSRQGWWRQQLGLAPVGCPVSDSRFPSGCLSLAWIGGRA